MGETVVVLVKLLAFSALKHLLITLYLLFAEFAYEEFVFKVLLFFMNIFIAFVFLIKDINLDIPGHSFVQPYDFIELLLAKRALVLTLSCPGMNTLETELMVAAFNGRLFLGF